MGTREIAVFSTTGIFCETPAFPGQKPVYEEQVGNWSLSWYSTGRLEEALGREMTVYVCSIRPLPGEQDAWWRRLVEARNVIFADELLRPFAAGGGMSVLLGPWRRLYARLGIAWDEAFSDPEHARAALAGSGIVNGNALRGFSTRGAGA